MKPSKQENKEAAQELLCLLNLARLDTGAEMKAISWMKRVSDWPRFFSLIQTNEVPLLTYRRLSALLPKAGLDMSEWHEFPALAVQAKSLEDQTWDRLNWMKEVLSNLYLAGIEVILLTGGLLAYEIYDSPVAQHINEIDIFVQFDRAQGVSQILKRLGFTSVGLFFGKKEISSSFCRTLAYVSFDLKYVVNLHWGLHSPDSLWTADPAGIWRRKQSLQVDGIPIFRMSWEDNLLYLCIRIPFYKIGLADLASVSNLILFCKPKLDWDVFYSRVVQWKAQNAVLRILVLAKALIPFEVPEDILIRCREKATSFNARDTFIRVQNQKLLFESRSTYVEKIERAYTVFKVSENYFDRVQAWATLLKLIFFPPEAEIRKMVICQDRRFSFSYLWARLKTPRLIFQAMAYDHGSATVLRITLVNLAIVVRETLFLSFLRKKESLSLHPFSRLL